MNNDLSNKARASRISALESLDCRRGVNGVNAGHALPCVSPSEINMMFHSSRTLSELAIRSI